MAKTIIFRYVPLYTSIVISSTEEGPRPKIYLGRILKFNLIIMSIR